MTEAPAVPTPKTDKEQLELALAAVMRAEEQTMKLQDKLRQSQKNLRKLLKALS